MLKEGMSNYNLIEESKDMNAPKKHSKRSTKGASVVFAIVGFMFAAMISMVVVNAAYSSASRLKTMKQNEQTYLLAKAVTDSFTEALAADDGSTVTMVAPSGIDLENCFVIMNRTIEEGTAYTLYEQQAGNGVFTATIPDDATDMYKVSGTTAEAFRTIILKMMHDLDKNDTLPEVSESITSEKTIELGGYSYELGENSKITMDNNREITLLVEVKSGDITYCTRLQAKPISVSKNDIALATVTLDSEGKITEATLSDTGTNYINVKSSYITWPSDSISSVFYAE